ncbi:hypothetical protein G5V57_18090 [Nordella sp. HKS 07]|uniref:hypothetical protein n=1 Tax=Nordella sp. HKS 07 TaxID=2712222 RepID=UPI0013E1B983|nr:hypothetical protein [Nordella sp. HKS 07]QIG49457.1 hypothetical protein G5V57_18090 [Nordella sp. HKS 07]
MSDIINIDIGSIGEAIASTADRTMGFITSNGVNAFISAYVLFLFGGSLFLIMAGVGRTHQVAERKRRLMKGFGLFTPTGTLWR